MTLKFDIAEMQNLMKSLYTLTGIRFVLFDSEFNEVFAYPMESCEFCRLMKACPKTRRRCNYADRQSFKKCAQTDSLVVYKCHSGLVEAVIPLHENENVLGYLMFGQITDNPDKTHLFETIDTFHEKYGFEKAALKNGIEKLACKSLEEISAAAKIMEACTSYILYKELITPENSKIIENAKLYIEEHLGDDFSINALCDEMKIGRTKLYNLFKSELKMGIAEYLRRRRLHRAKKLLKTTTLSITEIAEMVGFSDYNYFSRVYKKTYGKPPKYYR